MFLDIKEVYETHLRQSCDTDVDVSISVKLIYGITLIYVYADAGNRVATGKEEVQLVRSHCFEPKGLCSEFQMPSTDKLSQVLEHLQFITVSDSKNSEYLKTIFDRQINKCNQTEQK
jgi:hypothetical protein